MFTSSRTLLLEDHAATLSNLKLLLASDRGGLFGDPYYGTILKRFIFDQNDLIVKDLIQMLKILTHQRHIAGLLL